MEGKLLARLSGLALACSRGTLAKGGGCLGPPAREMASVKIRSS